MIERQGAQRILQATPATLRVRFAQAGEPVDPGTVTVTITRLDGSDVVTDGPTQPDGNARTYPLDATETADLDRLTVRWSSPALGTVETTAEIVGDHLFTIAEARAYDNAHMADANDFPSEAIAEARSRIEDDFAEICAVSFFPRLDQQTVSGNGTDVLLLPVNRLSEIVGVEVRSGGSWTALGAADLADIIVEPWGAAIRESRGVWPPGRQNIRVRYIHGYERVPLPIRRAGLILLRNSYVPSNIDPRAMSYSDVAGTIRFVTPGVGRNTFTDVPEVNATLMRYRLKGPAIG